jgi:TolA-binding protein
MKSAEKNIVFCIVVVFLGACGGYLPDDKAHWPVNPAEMHSWQPPDEVALSARRSNQLRLDDLTTEIETLFVNHATLSNQELAMFESMRQIDPKIRSMDSTYGRSIESEQARKNRMEKDLEMAKLGFSDAEKRLKKLMAVKPPVFFPIADYNLAMKRFRNGQFNKSLELFFKINKQKPPLFLQDNIHFGMGSAYYRLKNYPKAKTHFQTVLDNYAQGDKRFISYFMMGVIHNIQGEKSRAVFFLEEALGNNPPPKMRNMINHLIDIINDESTHVTG